MLGRLLAGRRPTGLGRLSAGRRNTFRYNKQQWCKTEIFKSPITGFYLFELYTEQEASSRW